MMRARLGVGTDADRAGPDLLRAHAGVVDGGLAVHAGGLGGVRIERLAWDHAHAVMLPLGFAHEFGSRWAAFPHLYQARMPAVTARERARMARRSESRQYAVFETARRGTTSVSEDKTLTAQRMKREAGIQKTRVLHVGDSRNPHFEPFDFETFDTGTAFGHAKQAFQGRIYPPIPFVKTPARVLDIGANIGASAVTFALRYPGARIVAVEPANQPFALLRCKRRGMRTSNATMSDCSARQ